MMANILFAAAIVPMLFLNGTLSLASFCGLLSRRQKLLIHGVHAFLLLLVAGGFYYAAVSGRAMFALIKHTLLGWSVVTTAIHIAILPKHFREWIFSAALATLFHYLIGAVGTYLTNRYFGWYNIEAYICMELLTGVLNAVFYWPIRRSIVKAIRPSLSYTGLTYWRTVYLIPTAMLGACYFMLPGNSHMETTAQLLGRLFMVVAAFFICNSIAADFSYFQERHSVEEQLQQQKMYYSEMSTNLENARRQRHDRKHHLVTIQHYIETNDLEALREYCGALLVEGEIKDPIPYSGNGAADGVIYHYMRQSAQKGIKFSFQGTIRSEGIADTDLCVLLGNALDNALAGCMTIPENRFIQVTACSEKQLLSFLIQNSFDGVVQGEKEKILSRKRQNREGVGLSSMNAICDRYGGMLDRSWDENTFTVCIHLPLPEPVPKKDC